MKENKYDDPGFFQEYAKMQRSIEGLPAAGEWVAFREALPSIRDKRVLDIGCGYGWHCRYFAEMGAKEVVGIDISEKMIARAREMTNDPRISYSVVALEDFTNEPHSFDLVISSLALHYVSDLKVAFSNVNSLLKTGGNFCYSTEHPIFTSREKQDWCYDVNGNVLHWPVDGYFIEGKRNTNFLGANVTKYHRTIESHFQALQSSGFGVDRLIEPVPSEDEIKKRGWENELRRPMMLLMVATKA